MIDDDCEDQGMMATETCVRLMCEGVALRLSMDKFWYCPRCQASYGADAKSLSVAAGEGQ